MLAEVVTVSVAVGLLNTCDALVLNGDVANTVEAVIQQPLVAGTTRALLATAGFAAFHAALIIMALEKNYKKEKKYEQEYKDEYHVSYAPPYHEPPPADEEPGSHYPPPESSYVSHRSSTHAHQPQPPPPPSDPSPSYRPPAQRYHKRSTTQETWGEEVVELEKLLVSAASRLDTDGCVLKLLCHLNNKQAHARTLEENVLLQLFSNNPDTLSFYHATFDNTAADVSKTQEQVATAACDKVFSSCTLGQEELSSLLQHTWPCPNITP
ncbi:uncharacterized protein [Panulirus ornatus]|uniref:uncharacterized protein isoform X1 n=1 Tax=Panulirus ornatus TaxID=150431 RepID=UPI003A86342E